MGGQIGLEETPEQYVAKLVGVFSEVRRVLRKDGTVWLNLGDSYCGSWGNSGHRPELDNSPSHQRDKSTKYINRGGWDGRRETPPNQSIPGLKPKDLIGIPWAVAKALQQPNYLGKIKSDINKAWIAAMIDGEGTICGFDHLRKDDGRIRTGINICITNSNLDLLDRCFEIYPTSRSEHNSHGEGHFGSKPTYRWIVHGTENKIQFIKEIYPYLIAKKKQALLAYNLLLFQIDAKKLGKTPMKNTVNGKRQLLTSLISELNQGNNVDIPDWCLDVDVKSLFDDGWWLRCDIIWFKRNPMPESVRDRPTRSHEYIFLLSKSQKYYYDADAIAEPAIYADITGMDSNGFKDPRKFNGKHSDKQRGHGRRHAGFNERWDNMTKQEQCSGMRNKRTVWDVPTRPFPDAHFATFPEDLIRPCIIAGCPENGIVLDPFMGAGTTALVAYKAHRNFIGSELNQEYVKIANARLKPYLTQLTLSL